MMKYDEIKKVVFAIASVEQIYLFFAGKIFAISATVDPTVLAVLQKARPEEIDAKQFISELKVPVSPVSVLLPNAVLIDFPWKQVVLATASAR